jgi:hypothetical protein
VEPTDLDIHAENSYFWSPTNSTFYPWTLPYYLVSPDSICAPLPALESFELLFPPVVTALSFSSSESTDGFGAKTSGIVKRVKGGLSISGSMRGIRMGLVNERGVLRVANIGSTSLGKGEMVFLEDKAIDKSGRKKDPNFEIVEDREFVDLIIQYADEMQQVPNEEHAFAETKTALGELLSRLGFTNLELQLNDLLSLYSDTPEPSATQLPSLLYHAFPAILATGPGAAPIPSSSLYTSIHAVSSYACTPVSVPGSVQVLIVPRGGCPFSEKISNLPSTVRTVVFVDKNAETEQDLVRPLLDTENKLGIGAVMVAGGVPWTERDVGSLLIRRRWGIRVRDVPVSNIVVL